MGGAVGGLLASGGRISSVFLLASALAFVWFLIARGAKPLA
jgi:hypothetical protein